MFQCNRRCRSGAENYICGVVAILVVVLCAGAGSRKSDGEAHSRAKVENGTRNSELWVVSPISFGFIRPNRQFV